MQAMHAELHGVRPLCYEEGDMAVLLEHIEFYTFKDEPAKLQALVEHRECGNNSVNTGVNNGGNMAGSTEGCINLENHDPEDNMLVRQCSSQV